MATDLQPVQPGLSIRQERAIPVWRQRRRASGRARRQARAFYLFISPWLCALVLLSIIPLAIGLLVSLTNYDGLNLPDIKWMAFRNFTRAFNDSEARYTLGRTGIWTLLNTPLWLAVSLGLATLMNQKIRLRGFFRTMFYLPSAVPVVATVWIWRILLDKNYGMVNGLLDLARPGTAVPWLTDYAMGSLTAISLWTGLGSGMVIFLAGLQSIPAELEEAARIDGANGWQVWRHVTLPLITPVVFFQLVLALISSLQAYIVPMLIATAPSSGSDLARLPPRSVQLFMVYTFQQIFVYRRFGYGIALLWLLFILIVGLTFLVFRTQRYWVYYESDTEEG